jgi:hypothetical protein
MYVKYVSDDHRPTRMMVLSEALLSFMAMAPPARRLCEEMRSRVYPRMSRQSYVTPHRTAVPMSRSDTSVERCPAGRNTALIGHLGDFACWMFAMRWARADTGHIGPPNASWCTTAPFVPFLVFAMQIVVLSAVSSVVNPAEWGISTPFRHIQISQSLRAIVRLALGGCPLGGLGVVYSPTWRR